MTSSYGPAGPPSRVSLSGSRLRRAGAISREVDELRTNTPLVGTPAEIVDRLGPFVQAGVQRVYLQVLDLADLDHVELFANEVVGQLR